MPKKTSRPIQKNALRQKAEKVYSEKQKKEEPRDPASLVHELQVHQIELEMQNEELTRAKTEVEEILTKYTNLYDFAPVGYLTFDEKGLISEANLTATNLLGFERAFLINKPFHSFIQREFQDRFYLYLQGVLGSPLKQTCELLLKKKDGASLNAQLDGIAVNAGGHKTVKAALTDITERKHAEEALKRAYEELELRVQERTVELQRQAGLLDLVSDAIILCGLGGKIRFWNQGARDIYGFTKDEAEGKIIYNLLKTRFPIPFEEAVEIIHREGRWEGELAQTRKDGTEIIVESKWVLEKDESGRPRAIMEVNLDITRRRRGEQALRESEERYRTAIESASDGIALVREGLHMYVNRKFVEIFGYKDPEEIIGKPLALTVHPDDLESVSKMNAMRLEGHPVPSLYEFKGIRKDGTPRFIEISATTTTFRGESVALTYLRDITDYKRLEEELRRSQKMEAIGTFASGIAHDFNNILAGIIGFTEMTLDDISPNDPTHRRMERVLKAGQRGHDLVKQILTFSRQTGKETKIVAFGLAIEEALHLLRAVLPSTIDIRKTFTSVEDTIIADPIQLQQVLMNLCTNAAYAMRARSGVLEVGIADADVSEEEAFAHADMKPGRYIRLSVSDTGSGISAHDMKKIFDPFFTTKGPGEGTGLGLSVTHGIVKNHGGHVRVYSEPEKGTVFHIYLPKTEAATPEETSLSRIAERGQERILFVDDEEMLVEMNCQRLERLGYTVVASTNGREALDIFKTDPQKFDLVITDYTMPQMTGVELARALVEVRPDIPIILCSGLNERIATEQTAAPGIRAFIAKPSGRQKLAELIRKVLSE
jgi:PAS domain S-box-containing protein